jgi:Tfp pilus assembly protein PilN
VRDRISAIQALLAQRAAPVAVLDAIGQSLPARAWLVDIDLKITDLGATLLVDGRSYSNEDISDYVDRLSESSVLESVELEAVAAERGDGQGNAEVKGFKLVVKPKGFAKKAPEPAAAASTNAAAKGTAPGAPPGKAPGAARDMAAEGGAN